MAKRKIRLGLIGCGGNMRGAHIPRLKADGRVELVAVADPEEASARRLLEAWGAEAAYYADYRQMIGADALDGVLISSPHSTHYAQARYALERDLHVLVEKPLTTKARHAQALIDLAAERERVLVVSYQRNFYPAYAYARELVQKGCPRRDQGGRRVRDAKLGRQGMADGARVGRRRDVYGHRQSLGSRGSVDYWFDAGKGLGLHGQAGQAGGYGCRGQCAVSRRRAGVAELCRQREPARRAAVHPRRQGNLGLSLAPVAGAGGVAEWGAVGGAQAGEGRYAGRGLFALDSQWRQGL